MYFLSKKILPPHPLFPPQEKEESNDFFEAPQVNTCKCI